MGSKKHSLLSLFTGAGGLDLGLESSGFEVVGCMESDHNCRETIRTNTNWPITENGDVHTNPARKTMDDFGVARGELDLLAGGPPCQPFSKSGRWVNGGTLELRDPRAQTLFAFLAFVETALPRVMLLENVEGFASLSNAGKPSGPLLVIETALAEINRKHKTNYVPKVLRLDSADYGVPQKRRRIFVVASQDGTQIEQPVRTHSAKPADEQLQRLCTAWDSIGDLDHVEHGAELAPKGTWADLLATVPEGSNYQFHTPQGGGEPLFGWRTKYWSFLLKLAKNKPSWTIQAQPGPATGPFHWRSRRLSIQEMARLQTFPDQFEFVGSYGAVRRQIGNAVPVAIGELLGKSIRKQLFNERVSLRLSSIPELRDDCPAAERPKKVPKKYLALRGDHPSHPGTGKGPSALLRELS